MLSRKQGAPRFDSLFRSFLKAFCFFLLPETRRATPAFCFVFVRRTHRLQRRYGRPFKARHASMRTRGAAAGPWRSCTGQRLGAKSGVARLATCSSPTTLYQKSTMEDSLARRQSGGGARACCEGPPLPPRREGGGSTGTRRGREHRHEEGEGAQARGGGGHARIGRAAARSAGRAERGLPTRAAQTTLRVNPQVQTTRGGRP